MRFTFTIRGVHVGVLGLVCYLCMGIWVLSLGVPISLGGAMLVLPIIATYSAMAYETLERARRRRTPGIQLTVIDSNDSYTLLKITGFDDLLGFRARSLRFLKMVNPSTGEIHIEPVDPSCSTVQDALNFRRPDNLQSDEDWQPAVIK